MYVAALLCPVMFGGIVTRSGVWGSGVRGFGVFFIFFFFVVGRFLLFAGFN